MIPDPPSLYVHIPFCLSRCAYCTFTSGLYDTSLADAYLDAVQMELDLRCGAASDYAPPTLYVGGGTPSCLSVRQLTKLMAILPMPVASGEATLEFNPDSASPSKLDLVRQHGFNRCSFGVQTFSPEGLRLLDRRHDAECAKTALRAAVAAGFSSVSLDLITAWPGQTLACLRDDLRQALDLGVRHISCYNLMVDPEGSFPQRLRAFGRTEMDEDTVRKYWDVTVEYLSRHGFEQYEVSNFALPGHACRHNIAIWKGKEYHGIGAGAHSHIDGRRFANFNDVGAYIRAVNAGEAHEEFEERLPAKEKAKECAVFWLRLAEGIDTAEFRERTRFGFFDLYADELPPLLAQGYLEEITIHGRRRVRIAPRCLPLLDAVLVDLV